MGLAAGDRIGGPIHMALELAESLAYCSGFNILDVGQRYFDWWKTEGFDTGPTSDLVFKLVDKGFTFTEAAELAHKKLEGKTAGCNPAHRIAPVAAYIGIQDDDLAGIARQDAALTHFHPEAGDVSATVLILCRALIQGLYWEMP